MQCEGLKGSLARTGTIPTRAEERVKEIAGVRGGEAEVREGGRLHTTRDQPGLRRRQNRPETLFQVSYQIRVTLSIVEAMFCYS